MAAQPLAISPRGFDITQARLGFSVPTDLSRSDSAFRELYGASTVSYTPGARPSTDVSDFGGSRAVLGAEPTESLTININNAALGLRVYRDLNEARKANSQVTFRFDVYAQSILASDPSRTIAIAAPTGAEQVKAKGGACTFAGTATEAIQLANFRGGTVRINDVITADSKDYIVNYIEHDPDEADGGVKVFVTLLNGADATTASAGVYTVSQASARWQVSARIEQGFALEGDAGGDANASSSIVIRLESPLDHPTIGKMVRSAAGW